jgi:ribosomal protein S6 kinase alpha-5
LGTGALGRVYLVKKLTGKDKDAFYAMKVVDKSKVTSNSKYIEHAITEREVLESIVDCPFLATMHYAFQTAGKLYLVLEFVQGGELFTHLAKDEQFSEKDARFYIAEIIVALEQLHKVRHIFIEIKASSNFSTLLAQLNLQRYQTRKHSARFVRPRSHHRLWSR